MINSKEQIIEYFKSGIKNTKDFRIGIEHEKFLFNNQDNKRINYTKVKDMFAALLEFGWNPILEKENIIGLNKGGKNITLEPGNQIELSGEKLNHIHEACAESQDYLFELKQVTKKLDINIVSAGFDPISKLDEIPNNPKQRYELMTKDMPLGGELSLDMMYRTCGTQLNIDYNSEQDFIKKFKIGNSIFPISIALFANSAIVEKKKSNYLSYRSKVWQSTSRGGLPKLFFEDLKRDESSIYHDIVVWGSGNIAVYYALDNYDHVSMAGFDCDYTEFIPECKKQDDGSLIMTSTPKYNPNYFFNSYQQKGDIYSVPNGKPVHLNSWVELSNSIPEGKTLINYNDKTTLYSLFKSYPLNKLSFQYPEYNPQKKIAFCVPTTSKGRDWPNLQSTYLYNIMLESIRPLQRDYQVDVYIGYDHDDKLYSQVILPTKFNNMNF